MGKGSWRDSREWHDDEKGPVEALVLHEVSDEGDGLDGFAQAHLVGQDAVQVVVVQRHQPLQTFDLSGKGSHGQLGPLASTNGGGRGQIR